jgi:diguanylate cyclase (GGDEF)-like protein/PAS domain S-box-containing protein
MTTPHTLPIERDPFRPTAFAHPDPLPALAQRNPGFASAARAAAAGPAVAERETSRLQDALDHAEAVFVHSADLMMFFRADGTIEWVSAAVRTFLGLDAADLVGCSGFDMIHPDDWERVFSDFASIPNLSDSVRTEFRVQGADGTVRWIEEIATNLLDEPSVGAIVGNLRDITERKAGEQSAARLVAVLESSHDAIFSVDPDGRVATWNRGAVDLFGYSPAQIVGRSVRVLLAHQDPAPLHLLDTRVRGGEQVTVDIAMRTCDGRGLQAELSIAPLYDAAGAYTGSSSIARDMTERIEAERALQHQATHDPLTGLLNRSSLVELVQEHLDRSGPDGTQVALAFFDLDQFKRINDTLGHSTGDLIIREVGARLSSHLREGDLIGRFGGDEFLLVRLGAATLEDARALADDAEDALRAPVRLSDRTFELTASIGVTLSDSSDSAESLLRDADAAMYQAKADGRARSTVFDTPARARAHRRVELQTALAEALDHGELRLAYQPVVDLADGSVAGFEALLRWEHPVLGAVGPDEFVPIAETTGLIVPIGDWVIEEAVRQLAEWRRIPAVRDDLWVAVNLSTSQLGRPELVGHVDMTLRAEGLPPGLLHLEVTESLLMDRVEHAMSTLAELRWIGARVSIDDFGTGYSSLSYLNRLSIDTLKVDRSFIQHLGGDGFDASIVATIAALGGSLGLSVVAEGIETEAQLAMLVELGCGYGQGYLWSRPLSPDLALEWVLRHDLVPAGR